MKEAQMFPGDFDAIIADAERFSCE